MVMKGLYLFDYFMSFAWIKVLFLLARTGILTVALLAGDIGQSGLVPGQEPEILKHEIML